MDKNMELYEKVSGEYSDFIDELRTKPPDEIIDAAYQKVCKQEIVMVFENYNYNIDSCTALLELENVLDYLYDKWIDMDSSDLLDIRECVDWTLESEMGIDIDKEDEVIENVEQSAFDKALSRGKEKSEAYKAEKSANQDAQKNKKEDYSL